MKKALLLLNILSFGYILYAQKITITQSDIAPIGKYIFIASDTLKTLQPGSINPGPSGENQVWNYTTLESHSIDTVNFVTPSSTPYASYFPSSNTAIQYSKSGMIAYIQNISSSLVIDGSYVDFGLGGTVVDMIPDEKLISYPDSFKASFQNTSLIDVVVPFAGGIVDSIRYKSITTKNSKTDGWGKIVTPKGSFKCLRHKDQIAKLDSIWMHLASSPPVWMPLGAPTKDTTWHFSWWANGTGFPILEFDSTHADTIKNINWLKSLPVIIGIDEPALAENAITIYPVPSSGLITLESKKQPINDVEVFNVQGESVYLEKSLNADKRKEIDLSSLTNGIYFLRINSKDNSFVKPIAISK